MLSGKTAVITGGSRGIGEAIAKLYAQNNCNVAIVYAGNKKRAENVLNDLSQYDVKKKAYCCDVSDFDATKKLIANIISDFGGLDIVVNNAGIVKDGLVLSMKEEDFDNVINVNLKGAFNIIKHSYKHLMKQRSGRIINLSSVVGLSGNAGQANYSSSKAGIIGLTKSVAKELAGRNVLCNAIAPGYIQTDMTALLSDKVKGDFVNAIPLKRSASVDEVANVALFLASDMASYITGEIIRVDGGLAM